MITVHPAISEPTTFTRPHPDQVGSKAIRDEAVLFFFRILYSRDHRKGDYLLSPFAFSRYTVMTTFILPSSPVDFVRIALCIGPELCINSAAIGLQGCFTIRILTTFIKISKPFFDLFLEHQTCLTCHNYRGTFTRSSSNTA